MLAFVHIFSFICVFSESSWDTFQANQSFVESFITLVCRLFLTSTTEKNYVKLKVKTQGEKINLSERSVCALGGSVLILSPKW